MKTKYFFIAMMVFILACSAVAAAETAYIDDYTFTVPDGFKMANESEHLTTLVADKNHEIVLKNPDIDETIDQFKADLEKDEGAKFTDGVNSTVNGYEIEQFNYTTKDAKGFFYAVHIDYEADDFNTDLIFINYEIPSGENAPAKMPVDTILESFTHVDD